MKKFLQLTSTGEIGENFLLAKFLSYTVHKSFLVNDPCREINDHMPVSGPRLLTETPEMRIWRDIIGVCPQIFCPFLIPFQCSILSVMMHESKGQRIGKAHPYIFFTPQLDSILESWNLLPSMQLLMLCISIQVFTARLGWPWHSLFP